MKTSEQIIRNFVRKIGVGFHPDTDFSDYIDGEGKRLYDKKTAKRFNQEMENCFDELGDGVYDIGLEEQQKLWKELV